MGIRVIEKCTVVRGLICPDEGTRTRSGGWVEKGVAGKMTLIGFDVLFLFYLYRDYIAV